MTMCGSVTTSPEGCCCCAFVVATSPSDRERDRFRNGVPESPTGLGDLCLDLDLDRRRIIGRETDLDLDLPLLLLSLLEKGGGGLADRSIVFFFLNTFPNKV